MSGDVFESVGFHPIIEQWFKERYAGPSPPQADGWPSIATGNHTLILAPTGSGKTLAAFLWCIDQLFRKSLATNDQMFDRNSSGVHTLYISPLKALSNDIHQNLKVPLKEIQRHAKLNGLDAPPIRAAVRTGDTPSHVRQSMLRKPPHILITTPESFYLLLTSERGRELFRALHNVIIDEIHAVCGNKRGVHLSLSLERMTQLCLNEPIRIGLSATQKPLELIAAYLGGQQCLLSRGNRPTPRPVNIVDCGQRKHMDLEVLTPVASFRELPESSVWQPVYNTLYKLIQAHDTTLVFTGMRAQTERIARELNQLHQHISGNPEAELALAHHGSISRQTRHAIETRLKTGGIPAVIATASLELGIDIGGIDLVVQLESPKNVTGAIQRIGRSGHLLSATSKGRIIVLYPGDLDDAVTIVRCMHGADIEKARIPENALDVLAQQIVAEVALKSWKYEDLYHLVRQSYCYRNLPEAVFKSVLEMLSGRFSDTPLRSLSPRLNWDRINNRLITRRGSRLAAVMNAGTIPDRGYYGVYLENTNVKLGEVEEEFVFESRVAEVFFLGNSEWLIKQITADRIIVSPVSSSNPRAPFWKGDILHRDYSTSQKIGRFREDLIQKIHSGTAHEWLTKKNYADENTAANLVNYFVRQQKKGRAIATDKQVVAEWTIGSGGEPLLIVHAPFGSRVNGAWAIALAAALEEHYKTRMQYSYDDDGILIRLPDATETPPFDRLFKLSASRIEQFLVAALPHTPVFQVHFRYNAARALMLPRSHPGKRIPLWLQRLRASDLLQAVGKHSEFPLTIETYRECLQDIFDLAALKTIINKLKKNRIRLKLVDTSIPSPMAAGILFKFVSVHLYEMDQDRQPGKSILTGSDLLHQIIDLQKIPAIITSELVTQAERCWQHLAPHFQAASREDLYSIIENLGPIDDEDLNRHCKNDPAPWLNELLSANRIIFSEQRVENKIRRLWRIRKNHTLTSAGDDRLNIKGMIQRYLRIRGPVTIDALESDLKVSKPSLNSVLNDMLRQKEVVCGLLMVDTDAEQWCDRHNFSQLYRMAVGRRRVVQQPADRSTFIRFLVEWHRLSRPGQSLEDIVHRYRGFRFPLYFFEREILGSRYRGISASTLASLFAQFEELISSGKIIAHSGRTNETGNPYLEFRRRGEGNLLTDKENLLDLAASLRATAKIVFDFLRENGASYAHDLQWATGLSDMALNLALQELAEKGLTGCENYQSFMLVLQSLAKRQRIKSETPLQDGRAAHAAVRNRRRRTSKSSIRKMVQGRNQITAARWFLTTSLVIMGKPADDQDRAYYQARLLLQRYGILVKEWYRRENGLLPWHQIFQVLKRLEWQGEIRRGYFISGLSGVQFALPEALEILETLYRKPSSGDNQPILLCSMDPALPFSGGDDSGLIHSDGNPLKLNRSPANHLVLMDGRVIITCERYFQRFSVLNDLPQPVWEALSKILHGYLKMSHLLKRATRLEIHQINNQPAAASPYTDKFMKAGFEKDGDKMILWPSAI